MFHEHAPFGDLKLWTCLYLTYLWPSCIWIEWYTLADIYLVCGFFRQTMGSCVEKNGPTLQLFTQYLDVGLSDRDWDISVSGLTCTLSIPARWLLGARTSCLFNTSVRFHRNYRYTSTDNYQEGVPYLRHVLILNFNSLETREASTVEKSIVVSKSWSNHWIVRSRFSRCLGTLNTFCQQFLGSQNWRSDSPCFLCSRSIQDNESLFSFRLNAHSRHTCSFDQMVTFPLGWRWFCDELWSKYSFVIFLEACLTSWTGRMRTSRCTTQRYRIIHTIKTVRGYIRDGPAHAVHLMIPLVCIPATYY